MDINTMESKLTLLDMSAFLRPLETLAVAPTSLYITGTLPKVRQPAVAIVGTRRPSSYGKEVTYQLAHALARKGVIIVSGLAFGIDAIAHRAALDAKGTTIAVLAGGLDSIYPRSHEGLARSIVQSGGALVSEYPPGVKARQYQFLARNRLVSGLSDGVVVTEAAERSGTLSTINHALDQNKEVFAVPGNINSILSIGPNRFIAQGAHPVLSVESILEVIAPHIIVAEQIPTLTPAEHQLVSLIQQGIHDGDVLQERSTLRTGEFLQTLTMLELNGHIRSIGPNQWGTTV
ncbi:MAG: DNA-processing protein DprA [Candidatus Microsaccharimonas sp.]